VTDRITTCFAPRRSARHRAPHFSPGEQELARSWLVPARRPVRVRVASETYGQVIGEALWSGLPVVAFEDGMGVTRRRDRQKRIIDRLLGERRQLALRR
jgi:hypothetical protein